MELKKLYNLEENKKIDIMVLIDKMKEEASEVEFELVMPITNKDNLASELLDLMQVCMGIAYKSDIDLSDYIDAHTYKLMSRGHKLID